MAKPTNYWEIPHYGDDKNKWYKWVKGIEKPYDDTAEKDWNDLFQPIKDKESEKLKDDFEKLKEINKILRSTLKKAIEDYKSRLRNILINEAGFPESEADEIIKNTFN